MAVEQDGFRTAGLRTVEEKLRVHRRAEARAVVSAVERGSLPETMLELESGAWRHGRADSALWWQITKRLARLASRRMRSRWMRRIGIGVAAVAAMFVLAGGGLWFLLASGPISFDIATPWLAAAVAENFGNRFHVDIGGTVLERDEHGRTAMRIRSITVRDHDGTVVASAPKAEVGFSTGSLLNGRLRAERLNLVGAELAIRVEADGKITVSTGADQRPLATAPALRASDPRSLAAVSANNDNAAESSRSLQESFAAFLSWVDSLGA